MGGIENNQTEKANEIKLEKILKEKYPNINYIDIKTIQENVLSISTDGKNITSFFNSNGELLLSLSEIRNVNNKEKSLTKQGMLNAGYYEIEDNNTFNLYKIGDIDLTTLKPIIGAKPLEKHSIEYYNAWVDIDFSINRNIIEKSKKTFNELPGYYVTFYEGFDEHGMEKFYKMLNQGVIKIEDLEFFVKEDKTKNKQITQKMFNEAIAKLNLLLPKQCLDTRFRVLDFKDGKNYIYDSSITIDDLEGYLQRGRISQDIYDLCKRNILQRDELLKNKKEKEGIIIIKTKDLLENEKKEKEILRKMILDTLN